MTHASLDALADLWRTRDPAPDGLADRALVAIAMERIDEEYELLHLVERSSQFAGTRAVATSPLSISFVGDDTSLLLRVSVLDGDRRIDGWLAPAQAANITVRGVDHEWHAAADENGRFEIPTLTAGLARVVIETIADDSGSDPTTLFVTPAVEL